MRFHLIFGAKRCQRSRRFWWSMQRSRQSRRSLFKLRPKGQRRPRRASERFPQIHRPRCPRPGIPKYPKGRGSRPVFHKRLLVGNRKSARACGACGKRGDCRRDGPESRGAPLVGSPHGETKRVGLVFDASGGRTVQAADERFPQINRLRSRCPRYLNIARGNGRARFSTRNLLWKSGSARGPVELVGNAAVDSGTV